MTYAKRAQVSTNLAISKYRCIVTVKCSAHTMTL